MTLRFIRRLKLSGFLLIVALLVLWELSARARWVDSPSWPAFSAVVGAWWELLIKGELPVNVWMSLKRMFIGYFGAAAVGVGLGLLMGYFRFFYNLFEPLSEMLRPIPSPAYIPIAILFLGIGDTMKVFMIGLACLFPILLNTYSGVLSVDPVQINTGRTFGLNKGRILLQIVLPSSAPYIFTGLRISLAVGLILAVISEMVAANDGIGYFILFMQRSFQVRQMYAGVITLAMVGYALNWLFMILERRMLHWHHGPAKAQRGEAEA